MNFVSVWKYAVTVKQVFPSNLTTTLPYISIGLLFISSITIFQRFCENTSCVPRPEEKWGGVHH